MLAHCYSCKSKKEFILALDDIKKISSYIKKLLIKFDYDNNNRLDKSEIRLMQNISLDNKNVHIICGHCINVNTNELYNAEQELKLCFIKAIRVLKNNENDDTKKLKGELFNILRGHYPIMARVIKDKIYLKF